VAANQRYRLREGGTLEPVSPEKGGTR
jgi:hypothetical protein